MQRVSNRLIYVALATILVAGCSDTESRTDLNPDGPPMVRQVRLSEKYIDGAFEKTRRVFAFGTHPLADDVEIAGTRPSGMVTTASAVTGATGNKLRIIVDELLVGNNIEEVACRGTVTAQSTNLGRVPRGATPEDVARCSLPDDVLPKACPASNPRSICICQNPAGCIVTASGAQIAMGQPVGVLDIDQDGAPDDTRMIPNSVKIRCKAGTLDVPIDLDNSYWNPSGDQNRPAIGGFEALGPAIVLVPSGALPTNVECELGFADGTTSFMDVANPGQPLPAVTDKQDLTLCTPPLGDVDAGCTPGDASAFKFKVEALALVIGDTTVFEGAMGVNTNISAVMNSGGVPLSFVFNSTIAPASVTGITFSPALPAGTMVTITGTGTNARTVRFAGTTPLAANTVYTVTISSGLTDTFNQPMPSEVVIHFTTGT